MKLNELNSENRKEKIRTVIPYRNCDVSVYGAYSSQIQDRKTLQPSYETCGKYRRDLISFRLSHPQLQLHRDLDRQL